MERTISLIRRRMLRLRRYGETHVKYGLSTLSGTSMPNKLCILLVQFVIFMFATNSFAGESQRIKWVDLAEHLVEESTPLLQLNVFDCPDDIEKLEPSRSVAQFIENTFYLWEEYEFVTEGGDTGLFIVMKKPEAAYLSAEEAQVLLTASSRWIQSQPRSQDVMVLDASDPRLNLALIDTPLSNGQDLGLKVVVGDDDRTRVNDTTSYPWNTHCYVEIDFPWPVRDGYATGCLVAPHMLLTCGHCVYDRAGGVFANRLIIAPGQTQEYEYGPVTRPYGTREATELRADPRYLAADETNERFGYDYGAALFNTPFPGINTYMPVEFSENLSVGDLLYAAGYPSVVKTETNSEALWEAPGLIVFPQPDELVWYTVDSTDGQSGSPVRKKNPDRIVGVHAGGSQTKNAGPRLTSHNQALITEWMQWTPPDKGDSIEYPSSDVPKPIPDLGTVASTLTINETGTIDDLNVKLNITHWWAEDLKAVLIAPDGTRVPLFTHVGGSAADFRDTVFDDEAPQSIGEGFPPFEGSYRPEEPLGELDGKDITGTWTLEISDDGWLVVGDLNSWSLMIRIQLPKIFEDSFQSTIIDPKKWTVVGGATVDDVGSNEPSPEYSLRLNGHPSGGDSIESAVIDLSSCSRATLTYYYERTGRGDSPEAGDDLIIDYNDGLNWVELDRQLGGGPDMTDYNDVRKELPTEALHANFRLRIRSIGTSSSTSIYDDWFVDDVTIQTSDGPGFRLLASTGLLGSNPFSLVELQMDPVAEVLVGPASYQPGLDFDSQGVLYGASDSLRIIDPTNGSYTDVGAIHSSNESYILMRSISFAPDGTLYGVSNTDQTLYTIDPASAFATEVGPIPTTDAWVFGIDFAPDGTLYGAFSNLVTIDRDTGRVVSSISNIYPIFVDGIDCAPDGYIYAIDDYELYRIDPLDGSAALIGTYGSRLSGIASQVLVQGVMAQSAERRAAGLAGNIIPAAIGSDMAVNILQEQALQAERQRASDLLQQ